MLLFDEFTELLGNDIDIASHKWLIIVFEININANRLQLLALYYDTIRSILVRNRYVAFKESLHLRLGANRERGVITTTTTGRSTTRDRAAPATTPY